MVVNSGRALIARLLAGEGQIPITRIGFGSGSTPAADDDTALENPLLTKSIADIQAVNGSLEVSWALAAGELTGKPIQEFALYASDGTLFAREVKANPVILDENMSLESTWRINLNE